MTDEQKAQRNAKRRENCHRKKAERRAANMTPETTGNCSNLTMTNNSIYPNMLMIIPCTIPYNNYWADIGAHVDSTTNKPLEPPVPFHPVGHDASIKIPPEELKREREMKRYV